MDSLAVADLVLLPVDAVIREDGRLRGSSSTKEDTFRALILDSAKLPISESRDIR